MTDVVLYAIFLLQALLLTVLIVLGLFLMKVLWHLYLLVKTVGDLVRGLYPDVEDRRHP